MAIALKTYFASNKQMGSRDRRVVASIVYQYYRIGNALINLSQDERIAIALFLCNNKPNELLQLLNADLNKNITLSIEEKLKLIVEFKPIDIFPAIENISYQLHKESFCLSHLIQPSVFIRVRPNNYATVIKKLQANNITYQQLTDDCLSIKNTTSLDAILLLDKEAVIQDYASQQIGILLKEINIQKPQIKIWDCCAASGGKSIMAIDVFVNKKVDLIVSDNRQTILLNLERRFKSAGINNYKKRLLDLTKPSNLFIKEKFNLVICDVPCTGSGTWGRIPENLVHFKKESIKEYTHLQKSIVNNTVLQVEKEGYFLYSTCSVYNEENEGVVEHILQQFPHFKLITSQLIEGQIKSSDTMYAALLKNG